ncbi:hypothetical protein [Streptomyces sp. NPDC005322]|uniref:hypothetical protein n=1 Tax=Streptomyces sp. NPDC005322 TaxID=3157032 RepID=UPI0033A5971E
MMWLVYLAGLEAAWLVLCAAADARDERADQAAASSTDPVAALRADSSALRAGCRALPAGDPR